MILLIISFIAGVLTVLAPCILPLLPVIIGGSISGEEEGKNKFKKVLVITLSLGISVIVFTLLLKASTLLIDIPPQFWTFLSGGIVFALGLIFIFPGFWEKFKFNSYINRVSNQALAKGYQKNNFWGDVIIGSALGPVFSTCSPTYFVVLATVLPETPIIGLIYIMAYTVGLILSLMVIAFLGQKIVNKLGFASNPKGWFKRSLGILFVVVGIFIILGIDKKIETAILDSGFFDVTKVEQYLLEKAEDPMSDKMMDQMKDSKSGSLLHRDFKAPEISGIAGYINTDGQKITIQQYLDEGKVVLLDVWTYSCINCQRTIPYLRDWYEKYHDQGLVIIGLHTPEFAFEKDINNVEKAVEEFGIKYPVVLDNDYSTWRSYGNKYWPRKYLIDSDGYVVYDHIGEGAYDETEEAIREALGLNDSVENQNAINQSGEVNFSQISSPEIYFGSSRNRNLSNGQPGLSGKQSLTLPDNGNYVPNGLYLSGDWNFNQEYAESSSTGKIIFKYQAKDVYMVLSSIIPQEIEIYQDGNFVKNLEVGDEKLYHIIEGEDYSSHTLEIRINHSGLRAFTFTFG